MSRSASINQDDLRNHNLSVVLSTLLHSSTPLSRAQLAKETGLTKATLSLLAEILLSNDVLEQLTPQQDGQSGRNGRPSTPLIFKPRSWAGLGMQINTDGYGCVVVDLAGNTLAYQWVDQVMEHTDPDDIFAKLDEIVQHIEHTLEQQHIHIAGAALALPGLVSDGNKLIVANNLGWTNLELTKYDVVNRLHAIADNEANLAAIAQVPSYAYQGSGNRTSLTYQSSFLYISTDVGVGGAVVRGGTVVPGDHGFAGELGHVSVDMNGPRCRCGRRGCLEMYAGRRELVKMAGLAEGDEAAKSEYVSALYQLWRAGNTKAVLAIDQALSAMASVAADAINIFDVDTIVLGGFWSVFEEDLPLRLKLRIAPQILARYAMDIKVLSCCDIEHPALYGAAAFGLRKLIDHPISFMNM